MGVICSFAQAMAVIGCFLVGGGRFEFSNTTAFYFSAKGCQKVVSCADTHFLFFGKICMC